MTTDLEAEVEKIYTEADERDQFDMGIRYAIEQIRPLIKAHHKADRIAREKWAEGIDKAILGLPRAYGTPKFGTLLYELVIIQEEIAGAADAQAKRQAVEEAPGK